MIAARHLSAKIWLAYPLGGKGIEDRSKTLSKGQLRRVIVVTLDLLLMEEVAQRLLLILEVVHKYLVLDVWG